MNTKQQYKIACAYIRKFTKVNGHVPTISNVWFLFGCSTAVWNDAIKTYTM